MTQENIGKYPFFDLAVECFVGDIVRREPEANLAKKPSIVETNDKDFDMAGPAKVLISGLGRRETDN